MTAQPWGEASASARAEQGAYGDRYPVSLAGRELGAFIIVIGVGIFGTLTGYLANLFRTPPKERPAVDAATIDDARHQLRHLRSCWSGSRMPSPDPSS